MTVVRTSISMSLELDQALLLHTISSHQSKSKVIETLLRENPLVQREIGLIRDEQKFSVFAVPGPEGMARFRAATARRQASASGKPSPTPAPRAQALPAHTRSARTNRAKANPPSPRA